MIIMKKIATWVEIVEKGDLQPPQVVDTAPVQAEEAMDQVVVVVVTEEAAEVAIMDQMLVAMMHLDLVVTDQAMEDLKEAHDLVDLDQDHLDLPDLGKTN